MRKLSDIIKDVHVLELINEQKRNIEQIVFDSRKADGNSVFVAMRGTVTDGHEFIPRAIGSECKCIVCEELPAVTPADVMFVRVQDSSYALGQMASAFYGHPSRRLKLLGVTGTNGKTTTATLLYDVAMQLGYKAGLFSTLANFIGEKRMDATHTTPDAVSLNRIMAEMAEAGCAYCFMEVSSHALVQNRVAGLEFAGGLFTNITHDHLDYHKTFKAYIDAKKMFFDGLGKEAFALVNGDDKNANIMVQNSKARKYTFSLHGIGDYKCKIIESMFEGMQLEIDNQEI